MIKKIINKIKKKKLDAQIKFIDIICQQLGRKLSYQQKLKIFHIALNNGKDKVNR